MNSAALMDNLRVVLVATRNPLNIGAAARAMSNFGCTNLRLVNPYDPAYREAVSAVGAAPVLANAEQFSTVAEAVADCALVVGSTAAGRRELHHSLCTLEAGARNILPPLPPTRAGRGKNRIIQRRSKPLPLAAAHSHPRGASLDEPGPGRSGLPLRTGARRQGRQI